MFAYSFVSHYFTAGQCDCLCYTYYKFHWISICFQHIFSYISIKLYITIDYDLSKFHSYTLAHFIFRAVWRSSILKWYLEDDNDKNLYLFYDEYTAYSNHLKCVGAHNYLKIKRNYDNRLARIDCWWNFNNFFVI